MVAFAAPVATPVAALAAPAFSLEDALAAPFLSDLVASADGRHLAWVRTDNGRRNIWVASAPGFIPRAVTQFTADDGQELTQLTWSPTGAQLVFVRGGDHDGNWAAAGNLAPNPTGDAAEPKVTLWRAGLAAKTKATKITEGDAPALSAGGQLAFLRDGQVWAVSLVTAGAVPRRLFFDRGKARDLVWSPDGSKLAFVSGRDDHSFITIWQGATKPLAYMAPSTASDGDPVWSPDSRRIAFTRRQSALDGYAGFLAQTPEPWSIHVADIATGAARQAWASATTLRASYPDVLGGANLHWGAGDRLVFLSAETNWQQLYSVPASGGTATRLTADGFMVEHVTLTPDRSALVFSANTGPFPEDDTRRHILRVGVA
ncbi:hypothetical protein IP88_12620, partial [alpha proteobacterium AAP81b]